MKTLRLAAAVFLAPIPFRVLGDDYLWLSTILSLYGISMAMLLKRRNIVPLFRIYLATLMGWATASFVPFDPARRTYEPIILGALGATAGIVFGCIWAARCYRTQTKGNRTGNEISEMPAVEATAGWMTNLVYAWLAVLILFLLFMPPIGYT